MRRLWRVKRVDFWIAVLAIVGVLSAGVLAGVVIGIGLSLAWLLYVSATPAVAELARQPGTTAFRAIEEYPKGERVPGVVVVRFDGGLTFVTSASLGDDIARRLNDADGNVTVVVIDFAGVNFVDSQGSDQIDQLLRLAERDGWSLRLARLRGDVRTVLEADGVLERLGRRHLHGNVDEAVKAAGEAGSPPRT
jgi:MFS superfamily sulfate permease-like transporter